MLMHVAGTFPDNYIYGKCIYYIWEYGEISENNTYLCTDHAPQVYIPCRIPCSSLVQYSLNCSLITRYSTTRNFKNQLLAIKGTLASLHCCCPSFVATICWPVHRIPHWRSGNIGGDEVDKFLLNKYIDLDLFILWRVQWQCNCRLAGLETWKVWQWPGWSLWIS